MILTIILVLWCSIFCVKGEDCVAGAVKNLRIHSNANLTWDVDPDELCDIDEFQVDIVGDGEDEFHFKVETPYVHLVFLEICEEWEFAVTPISAGVVGFKTRLVEFVPLPPDADLSLSYFNVTELAPKNVLIEWDLNNHTLGDCTLEYRVAITDRQTSTARDLYVTGTSAHLDVLSPCVPYSMAIRAVNRAHPTVEGPLKSYSFEIPPYAEDAPTLNSINIAATTVNMTFKLEDFMKNRCPILNLHVDGGNFFNLKVPVDDPFFRPPVEVNLTRLQPNSMYYFKVSVENSGVAGRVKNLNIDSVANLTWDVDPEEPCPINFFLVNAVGGNGIGVVMTSRRSYIQIIVIDYCCEYNITVKPYSNGVVGLEQNLLIDHIPIREDANLTITNFRVTQLGDTNTSLEWELAQPFHGDCNLRYQVFVLDKETSSTYNVNVTGLSIYIDTLSPCVPYIISIGALSSLPIIEGPLTNTTFDIGALPEDPPILSSVEVGTTTINMTWKLEDYMKNPCPVLSIHVDAGDYFNVTVPIKDPTNRDAVNVNLSRLQPDSMYYMEVMVVNSGGKSAPVPLAVQTLPLE
ncbi:hypothetical protein NQ315_001352 [Exocentrus adspersus]|uniref:Fibronectin type-III domain-containing protein n=1 Tax=Exocentrus adspersus TaxID=1586481 RepID=A0AAV8WFN1_9CUCU|nr:hypothetical protein NQ315_001352 [Exocentrus adspersus]